MRKGFKTKVACLVFLAALFLGRYVALADSTSDELQLKISDKNSEIRDLNAKIDQLSKSVADTQNTRMTLSSELKQIDAVNNKLIADVKLTAKKIGLAGTNILKLEGEVQDKKNKIASSTGAVSDSIKLLRELDTGTLPEEVLSGTNFSDLWNQVSSLIDFQSKLFGHIKDLKSIKKDLEGDKNNLLLEKSKAVKLKNQLSDQQKIAAQNLKYKSQLIKETSNKEANYKQLLADTEARKKAVEDELLSYESELKATINPESLPSTGTKVLSWPLDQIFITQYFGDTAFARSHSVYNGKGHNGIDLRAAIGTPVKAAAGGVVVGTGDTDPICYGASYGKWIMIDHGDGLATIYGHLSLVKVAAGEVVSAGDLIAYSGKTGYALGPHLHFTVAATQAVKIGNLKSKVKECGTYTIPLGPFNGYLNPLLYL